MTASRLSEALVPLGRLQTVATGQTLASSGEEIDSLCLLVSGSLRLYTLQGDREVTIAVLPTGSLLGAAAFTKEAARWEHYAEALGECQVCLLDPTRLKEALSEQPTLWPLLLGSLARDLQGAQERLSAQVFLEVSQRLAACLLELSEGKEGGAISERLSHQDLAHRVGSTRETITKLLGVFRDHGLLDLGYRRIAVMDAAALRAAAREPLR